MFSLSELASLNERQSSSKLLKPWWEVFMDYLVVLMLLVSVLSGTVLLSRDRVVCLPLLDPPATPTPTATNHSLSTVTPQQPPNSNNPSANKASSSREAPHMGGHSPNPPAQGRRTHLVYQQYIYISQVCYHEALPWYSRFFPYMALLQSLLLLASGSFWFHFPLTSARIEHFLAILAKCCESPWTSRALSHAAQQENIHAKKDGEEEVGEKEEEAATLQSAHPPTPSSPWVPRNRQSSWDSGTDSPLLKRADSASTSGPPSPLTRNPSLSLVNPAPQVPHVNASKRLRLAPGDSPRRVVSLGKSDGEQARALFERVRRFRAHCESSDVIYKVYLAQTIFKLLMVTLILGYSTPLLDSVAFHHTCYPEEHALLGYATFECTHALASLLHKLLVAYLTLVGLYGLLDIYTLSWILHSSLRQYSFHALKEPCSLRDVPDLSNDLAFLSHMADQYDPLLAQRLSVFLSPVSETRLLEENLERRFGVERLRSMTSVDAEGLCRLQLVALPRLPPALFTLSQLHVLKLELIADAKLTAQVANMTSLRELHLYHCSAAVEPGALVFLQERLEVLHLTFTQAAEIPGWVYSLRTLHELHLTGRLGYEGGVGRGWALGSLRHLRHLRVLVLRGMLQRVPGELCEVTGSLVRLEIHNEGTRLLVLTGLRRMTSLTELQLQGCQLERLPSALLALTNLRTLDLQHNNLRTLEELLSLAHLRRLSCLRLAYNHVLALPASVGVLRSLEFLDLSDNQLQNLPSALFSLQRLRRLLLAGNLLQVLPAEVKALQMLTELDVCRNRLEILPQELFSGCLELRILNVAHNSLGSLPPGISALSHLSQLDLRSNSLEELPAELCCCSGLHGGGLLVEDWLFHSLPRQVRDFLTKPSSPSGKSSETHSRPESDSFPYLSAAQWCFSSALESRI